jgi:hypothetical protein
MCPTDKDAKNWEYLEESALCVIISNGTGESDTGRLGGDRTRGHDRMRSTLCALSPHPHSTMHKWITTASAWRPAPPTIKCASSTCARTARPTLLSSWEGMLYWLSRASSHSFQAPGPGVAGGLGASQVRRCAGVVLVRWQGSPDALYLYLAHAHAGDYPQGVNQGLGGGVHVCSRAERLW